MQRRMECRFERNLGCILQQEPALDVAGRMISYEQKFRHVWSHDRIHGLSGGKRDPSSSLYWDGHRLMCTINSLQCSNERLWYHLAEWWLYNGQPRFRTTSLRILIWINLGLCVKLLGTGGGHSSILIVDKKCTRYTLNSASHGDTMRVNGTWKKEHFFLRLQGWTLLDGGHGHDWRFNLITRLRWMINGIALIDGDMRNCNIMQAPSSGYDKMIWVQ